MHGEPQLSMDVKSPSSQAASRKMCAGHLGWGALREPPEGWVGHTVGCLGGHEMLTSDSVSGPCPSQPP